MKNLRFKHKVSAPASDGVIDIDIGAEGDPVTHVEGYVGPADAVAEYATADQVDVPVDRAEQIIAVLVKVLVSHEQRRKGLGNELVRRFLDEAVGRGAEAVYLYAELSENPFELVDWYQRRWGFMRVETDATRADPVMIRVTPPPAG